MRHSSPSACVNFHSGVGALVRRYVVAARALAAGAEVLREKAVAVGPKIDSPPVCLGCYSPADETTPLCPRCGWPACSDDCAAAPDHALNECKVFADAGVRFQPPENWWEPCPQLECITPLRVLLEGERDPQRWKDEVSQMEAHNDIRRETPAFSEEQIHSVCGYLEVNAFELRAAGGSSLLRGLYPQMGLLSHRCVPNTTHSICTTESAPGARDQYRLIVRTLVPVAEGAELVTSYTHALEPTLIRREQLLRGKHFACDCARCADPTELGTNLSTLKCSKCDNGWCSLCEFATPGTAVRKVLAVIRAELDEADALDGGWADAGAVERREQLWRKYRSVLHPKHALICQLRHSLLHLYGRAEGYTLPELPDLLLERKVELAKDLLSVADVLKPGCSRLRGTVLYEQHAPLLLLARSQFEQGVSDERQLRRGMEAAAKALRESADILLLEPPDTAEGALGAVAKESLAQLEASIATLPSD
ncbi:SET domain-containing protein SmydA-8, isoform A [Gryllus bimaculatus]|nr:SET domain-containing protein SmydA-8, isoform A [Gryllus bimaculatus]